MNNLNHIEKSSLVSDRYIGYWIWHESSDMKYGDSLDLEWTENIKLLIEVQTLLDDVASCSQVLSMRALEKGEWEEELKLKRMSSRGWKLRSKVGLSLKVLMHRAEAYSILVIPKAKVSKIIDVSPSPSPKVIHIRMWLRFLTLDKARRCPLWIF